MEPKTIERIGVTDPHRAAQLVFDIYRELGYSLNNLKSFFVTLERICILFDNKDPIGRHELYMCPLSNHVGLTEEWATRRIGDCEHEFVMIVTEKDITIEPVRKPEPESDVCDMREAKLTNPMHTEPEPVRDHHDERWSTRLDR